jgi:hypothetical protein
VIDSAADESKIKFCAQCYEVGEHETRYMIAHAQFSRPAALFGVLVASYEANHIKAVYEPSLEVAAPSAAHAPVTWSYSIDASLQCAGKLDR